MREVRVADSFFADIDALFPPERSATGYPSADDIIRYVVPTLISEIGDRYDSMAELSDTPGIKSFVLPGLIVPAVVVYAGEMPDGIVYLLGFDVDSGIDNPS